MCARSFNGHCPPHFNEALKFSAAAMGRHEAGGMLLLGAEQKDLPGVCIRSPLLDVEVVAVVPAHHQAKVADGSIRRRTCADGDPRRTGQ
ncbi:hypothetical protein D3C73_1541530 [compost metagenome]